MSSIETKHKSVLIVGCGRIAGGFDVDIASDVLPCTHAGAYRYDGRFKLLACVDPDEQTRTQFANYWKIPHAFTSLESAIQSGLVFDVVSVCSPTSAHHQHVIDALKLEPSLIFCEKPLTPSLTESEEVVNACREADIKLCVNHNRRWDPELQSVRAMIESDSAGSLRSVIGFYNKGALNNGSHLIDLLHYLLGDIELLAKADPVFDYTDQDPTVPALLRSLKGIPIHLTTGHADDFALFELQFIFSNKIMTMRDGGQSWEIRDTIPSPRFNGYRQLSTGTTKQGGYGLTSVRAADNIYSALTSEQPLLSTGDSALQAQSICEQLISY